MAAGAGDVSRPRVVILGGGHENLTFTCHCLKALL
jgi:hypothetical protein